MRRKSNAAKEIKRKVRVQKVKIQGKGTKTIKATFAKLLSTSIQTAAVYINMWAAMHGMELFKNSFIAPRVKVFPSIIMKKTR